MKAQIIDNDKVNHLAFIALLDAGLLNTNIHVSEEEWIKSGHRFYFKREGDIILAVKEPPIDSNLSTIETQASVSITHLVNDAVKQTEKEFVDTIIEKIRNSCQASHYTNLCRKISTEAGMANIANRSIQMMAKEKLHLSATLALLESELEGMD